MKALKARKPLASAAIVSFEQVNVSWVEALLKLVIIPENLKGC